jgi:polyphosphate kinase
LIVTANRDAPGEAEISPGGASVFTNREISWLDFNQRVLWEAQDPRNPLLERIRFLAITANNLDEFISKRVGWLTRMLAQDANHRTVDGMTIAEQRVAVRERWRQMRAEMDACWRDLLVPALAAAGYSVIRYSTLSTEAQATLREYFITSIFPVLTPLVVDPAHPFPFISGGSLSVVLTVHPEPERSLFARVKVPANRNRFIEAGDGRFVTIEDLIQSHLDLLFPGVRMSNVRLMHVIRSAEVGTPGEAADDLLEVMEDALERRRLADAVAIDIDGDLVPATMELLLEELRLMPQDVYVSGDLLGLGDLEQLASLPLPGESFTPFTPATPSTFGRDGEGEPAFFATLRASDVLVHHPFESFDNTVALLLLHAAQDPQVLAIKHTTYRTSPDSPILGALIEAAARGKQVAVLVELAARFDEANNIEWARRLEDAGVHVSYGNPNQKIHAKISLVVREEALGITLYGHIGTGNYNSRTARVYTDLGLITTDPVICADLLNVFNHLTGLSRHPETKVLLVAPHNLRSELERRVRREIEAAGRGEHARVIMKANAVEDPAFTSLLYEASQAGVQVELISRGITRVRPGVPGLSDHIHVRSIIGRLLEHSRIYWFENGGAPEVFIGSADIMKRNLDERTEVLTPVLQPALAARVRAILDALLEDRRQSWTLQDRTWNRDQSITDEGVHERLIRTAPFS